MGKRQAYDSNRRLRLRSTYACTWNIENAYLMERGINEAMIGRAIGLGTLLGVTLTIAFYDLPTLFHQGNALGYAWPMSMPVGVQWVARLLVVGEVFIWVRQNSRAGAVFWIAAAAVHLLVITLASAVGKDLEGWPINLSRFGESFIGTAPQGLLQLGLVGAIGWVFKVTKLTVARRYFLPKLRR